MYYFLQSLLSDKKGGEIFTCFSLWHIFYVVLAIFAVAVILLTLKNKPKEIQKKVPRIIIGIAFGLYVADFFLMPLAYGEIDIEKLPFHACTSTCVLCFLSYRVKFLARFRSSVVLLGFISNLVYLIYPAGVMWHAVLPLSYRVVQTLVFHAVMTVFGLTVFVYESEEFSLKNWRFDLLITACLILWALLGNYVYNGTKGEYSHFFNWFFVIRDPFNLFPQSVAPFIMPFLNLALFLGAETVLRWLIYTVKTRKTND